MSNWIQLASGNGYDFDAMEIFGPFTVGDDLALPLAGENRYVRHTDRPWPVAVHSVAVARTILALTGDSEAAAAGLLHDCHEAIIGDIPSPVAWHLDYEAIKRLKAEVDRAIFYKLGIPMRLLPGGEHQEAISLADRAALHVERQLFMAPEPRPWNVKVPPHEWMNEMYIQVKGLSATYKTESAFAAVFEAEFYGLVHPLLIADVTEAA